MTMFEEIFTDIPTVEEIEGVARGLIVGGLLAYSEWLDSEGLMKKPKKRDDRTHEDLANQFYQTVR